MSDTPETDAERDRQFATDWSPGALMDDWTDFARRLERERNEARETASFYRHKVVVFGAEKGWTLPQPFPWEESEKGGKP